MKNLPRFIGGREKRKKERDRQREREERKETHGQFRPFLPLWPHFQSLTSRLLRICTEFNASKFSRIISARSHFLAPRQGPAPIPSPRSGRSKSPKTTPCCRCPTGRLVIPPLAFTLCVCFTRTPTSVTEPSLFLAPSVLSKIKIIEPPFGVNVFKNLSVCRMLHLFVFFCGLQVPRTLKFAE